MSPEEKAREIVNRCRINEWPDDTPMQEIAVNQLLYLIAQALTLPEVTSEEIDKAASENDESEFGNIRIVRAFEAGAQWMQKKLKGEK